MKEFPDWLPEIVKVDGEWDGPDGTLQRLYSIFKSEIKNGNLRIDNCRITWDRKIIDHGKEEAFWHITHRENKKVEERIFDLRRSERISWFAPLVNHFNDGQVLFWDCLERRNKIKSYLWLKEFDYLLIFKKIRPQNGRIYYFLVTAYYVNRKNRDYYMRKYSERIV